MQPLTDNDRHWIKRRLPVEIWKLLLANKHSVFVAGGFIRACIANEVPSDIDLFTSSKDLGRALGQGLVANGKGLRMVETDNAFTVLGLFVPLQFIHRWTFNTPQECVNSFDFTIARAAVWIGDEQDGEDHPLLSTVCDDRFYQDLAAKRLVYCQPVRNEDAGGSMLRVLKFYQRGYRIPLDSLGAVIARMAAAVDQENLVGASRARNCSIEHQYAHLFTGMLREVDPDVDPHHLAHLPAFCSPT